METKQRLITVVYDHAGLQTRLYGANSHLILNSVHQTHQQVVFVMSWIVMHHMLVVMSLYESFHHVATHSRCMKQSEQRPTV